MSVSELNKTTDIKNESANNINPLQQESADPATDMDTVEKEAVTPGPLKKAKSNEVICIDMETGMETQVGLRDQIRTGPIENLTEVTAHIINERAARQKLSIKRLYEFMGKQSQATRPAWDGGQTPEQAEQAVWMQYGPSQVQIPPQNPLGEPIKTQDPVQPTGPQFTQAQGYAAQGYGGYGGYPQPQGPQGQGRGQGYYQGHAYPSSGQAPQGQGWLSGNAPSQPNAGGYFPHIPPTGETLVYDPKTRNSFVRLVMFIVFIMLVITATFAVIAMTTPPLRHWFRTAKLEALIIAIICIMTANYGFWCSACGRVCPGSGIFLALDVIGMSLLCAKATCHYRTEIVVYAVIATAIVVMICVGLACTSFDFTSYLLYIVMIAGAFSVLMLVIFLGSLTMGKLPKPIMIALLFVGTLIQVVVLTVELQTVLGGKTVEISENDYALASHMLYTSIVDIFLHIVRILGLLD